MPRVSDAVSDKVCLVPKDTSFSTFFWIAAGSMRESTSRIRGSRTGESASATTWQEASRTGQISFRMDFVEMGDYQRSITEKQELGFAGFQQKGPSGFLSDGQWLTSRHVINQSFVFVPWSLDR